MEVSHGLGWTVQRGKGALVVQKMTPKNGASPTCRPTREQPASCCRSGWVEAMQAWECRLAKLTKGGRKRRTGTNKAGR
jgi:hypothetical protein